EGGQDTAGQVKRQLLGVFGDWHEPIKELIEATDESKILRNDIYDIDPLPRWTDGRAALLGDAAHATTPNLGQGACQAIEDAVVLGKCLRADSNVVTALREYEARRIKRANMVVMRSRQIGVVGQWENPLACTLRDTAMRLMPQSMRINQLGSIIGYEV